MSEMSNLEKFKKHYAPLMSLFMIVLLSFTMFNTMFFEAKIDQQYIINWLIGFVVMIYTYSIYKQTGIDLGQKQEKYKNSKKAYCQTVDNISNAKTNIHVVEFCEMKTLENYKKKRLSLMQQAGYLFLGNKTFENINIEELNKKQLKVYNKINQGIKTIEVFPSQLLSNSETVVFCDVRSHTLKERKKNYIIKVISNLVTTGVLAFLVFEEGELTISKITQLLVFLFIMGMSIYSSIINNYNSVVIHEVDAYIRKTSTNEEFIVWANDKEKEKVLYLPPPLEETKA